MGCTSSSLATTDGQSKDKSSSTKKQSSPASLPSIKKQASNKPNHAAGKDHTYDRLLSANGGTVFHLGPEVQKGVETRLRRLSAPIITPLQDDGDFLDKTSPSKNKQTTEQLTKFDLEGQVASANAEVLQQAAASTNVPVSEEPSTPEFDIRLRRMAVVDRPPAIDDAAEGNEDESIADGRESPNMLPSVLRNGYTACRSKSLQWKQLEDFDLMEHVIDSVASLSRAGCEPNYRKTNQDNCFAYQQYLHPSQALFGAMDGHGPNGHKVSTFFKKQFPVLLAKEQEQNDDNPSAMSKAFLAAQNALSSADIDCEFSGSTAVSCFLHGRELTTAWVGDSRAVIARQEPHGLKAVALTKDHKPSAHAEKMRILAAGGRVERLFDTSGKPIGPYRVWLQQSWVPGLAMSRALGDAVAHTVGVTSQPDTEVFTITRQDRFLILASDGIWEFIDGQGAVEMISGCSTAEEACRILVDAANQRWIDEEEGVVDDITAVVVKFK